MIGLVAFIGHLTVLALCVAAPLPLIGGLTAALRGGVLLECIARIALWLVLEVLIVVAIGVSGELTVLRLVLAEGVVAIIGLLARRGVPVSTFSARLRQTARACLNGPPAEQLACLTVVGAAAASAAVMVMAPTGDYDSWMYQLPQVAEWMQSHRLAAYQDQWRDTPTFARLIIYYPGNWTALFWLFTAPLHDDEFTLLPTLVGWLLLGASSAGLVRLAQGSRGAALGAAALVMTLPLAGSNLHSAHIDLGQGALLAGVLVLLANALLAGCRVSALISLGLAGTLVGTKMSGIPQLAAPVLLLGLLWRQRLPLQGRARLLGVIAVLSCAAGGWWYLHNWLVTGNPFGWVAVPSLGWHGAVDHAYIAKTNLLHTFHPGRLQHWLLVVGALLAGGGGLTVLAAIAIPLRLARGATRLEWALAAVALLLACEYIAGPWSGKPALDPDLSWWLQQQLRYTWTIWALLASLTVLALERRRFPQWLPALVACAAALSLPFATYCWQLALVALAVGVAIAWAYRTPAPARRHPLAHAAVFAVLIISGLHAAAWLRWSLMDHRGYGVPNFLETRLAPDETVAFWGSHQSWLLYGRKLEHRVHYIYLPSIEPATPLTSDVDQSVLIAGQLRAAHIRYLALGPKWHEFPGITYQHFESHPELFTLVHGDPAVWGMCVYQVRPPPPTAP